MTQTINTRELISDQEFNLLMGAKPFTPELTPVSYNDREAIMNLVMSENIEYRYINGSCEDRAHYISLLLKKNGIDSGKIWNFAPARYTFLSNELFEINDPFNITGEVTWGYHVAPYLLGYNQFGEIETLVIDQSFSPNHFMTQAAWLESMECPRAIHLLTDTDSYLFNSIYGYVDQLPASFETYYQTPLDIPSIITGNFWVLYQGDDFVQKGLAINDLAIEIFNIKQSAPHSETDFLDTMLKNIDEVIRFTATMKPKILSSHTFDHLIQFYLERYYYWEGRISRLVS